MSLPAFQTTVVNGSGEILTAATVTVTVESTGAAAVLFSDRNGTIGLGSGGVFSVNGTTAFAQFFAASGEYRVTADDAVSGFSETWRYVVLSGTASLVDTGLLTGNVPTADELSMVGQTVNYTGANYQPDVPFGIGVAREMKNISGSTITAGAAVPASSISAYFVGSTGTWGQAGATVAGSWKNTSGENISDQFGGQMTRES